MQIKCEKCSAVSDAAMPETYLEGEVELTFLRCPSCGEVYPVCATDSKLREDIAEYKEMRSTIRQKPVSEAWEAAHTSGARISAFRWRRVSMTTHIE